MKKQHLILIFTLALTSLIVLGIGCDSGDDGDDVSGTTTVEGTIQSFTIDGVAQYLRTPKKNILAQSLHALYDVFIPNASAQTEAQDVQVSVANTDLSTTTDENGFFIISGIPQGNQRLLCDYQGQRAEIDFYCPSNSTIYLNNVECQGGGHQQLNLSQDFQQNGGVCTVDGVQVYQQGGSGGQYHSGHHSGR